MSHTNHIPRRKTAWKHALLGIFSSCTKKKVNRIYFWTASRIYTWIRGTESRERLRAALVGGFIMVIISSKQQTSRGMWRGNLEEELESFMSYTWTWAEFVSSFGKFEKVFWKEIIKTSKKTNSVRVTNIISWLCYLNVRLSIKIWVRLMAWWRWWFDSLDWMIS